jgi:U3 small nucleolar RNA-associated protein 14
LTSTISGSKLNLDDLLSPLASQSSALQSLKTSAEVLASSSSKAKILSAPLPQRTQERLDRQAAYEQTKEEVDKWSETMRHIRTVSLLYFLIRSGLY